MSTITIKELRGMQPTDLRKEIRAQQTTVRKMRIEITMNTEKDTAKYKRERKTLARMMTVLTEKGTEGTEGTKDTEDGVKAQNSLQKPKKASTVSTTSRSRSRKSKPSA